MNDDLTRVTTYGRPVFAGPGPGALWQHVCGNLATVDLLGDGFTWELNCDRCSRRDGWVPLFAYTGRLCDQCMGNGWVPIGGKVSSAPYGFSTVTECTACEASGVGS
ncbi:hypothetical protein AB0F72_09255 [Actinoplanes sp. NPDC023936]|uniref:hypothetical protein n=1 Tax=Actinoplanes sp. NPDC023936 TaxID=3154910 RepID=UPI0033EBBF7B